MGPIGRLDILWLLPWLMLAGLILLVVGMILLVRGLGRRLADRKSARLAKAVSVDLEPLLLSPPRPKDKPERKTNWLGWILMVAGGYMLALLAWEVALWASSPAVEAGWSAWVVWPLRIVLFVVVYLVLIVGLCLLTKDGRRALIELAPLPGLFYSLFRTLAVQLWRRSLSRDIATARRAAGSAGSITRHGPLTIWTDLAAPVAGLLSTCFEQSAEQARQLRGQPTPHDQPLRLICFARAAAFDRYSRPFKGTGDRMTGYFQRFGARRVVMHAERADLYPRGLERTAVHEFAHYWFAPAGYRPRAPWLEEGLASCIENRVVPSPAEPGSGHRWLHVMDQRGHLLRPEALVAFDHEQFSVLFEHAVDAESYYQILMVYFQGCIMVDWLAHEQPAALGVLLAEASRREREPVKQFERIVGLGPAAVWQQATAEADEMLDVVADRPRAQPNSELAEHIGGKLVPLISDPNAPPRCRRAAIRGQGQLGYLWRADVLIAALVREADSNMRKELFYALSLIAGEDLGTEVAAWKRWLEGLDPALVER